MKICFKCGDEQPLSEFYKHSAMADGHLNKCKTCTKKDVTAHRNNNLDSVRSYDRGRGELEHRKARVREYQRTHRAIVKAAKERWTKGNRVKARARFLVWKALQSSKLVRQPCEVCGNSATQAHHDDYSKPLEVRWLCDYHHKEHHKMKRGLKRCQSKLKPQLSPRSTSRRSGTPRNNTSRH